MAQVSMTVRMDSQLKQNFDALCSRMGMSVNAAINIFANAVVRTRSIPFKISANPTEAEDQALRDFREFRNMSMGMTGAMSVFSSILMSTKWISTSLRMSWPFRSVIPCTMMTP